ncbi:two-component sensor histidine kinase [Lysinibacillus sp. KCTC 33748]|uniref:sensor histidine kinase n=1 Tax=unclassified Lysinibacillus TaxID=2636778 RepID=UPI0009A5E0A1|nr:MULTISPECIES: HAMP domain-containing sensor histidine kinase [unclassified Lysinibacillus]OXS66933.1 two-component sensor histidine kinase [Lysinibacillus sp. KCTC 33748]SKC16698.1 Signal transduction histidine kinase [Lysinibacillus sp. AC-3]
MKKISTRIWLLIFAFLIITVVFMYVLTDYLYERLYVEDTEEMMVEVGSKLQTMYTGSKVTDEFIANIEQYTNYSNLNIFAVRNPRELSACVPFDIDFETLIGPEERQQLLAGEYVQKIGYEPRFDRQLISVVLPLVDQNRLEGIIYIYFPLAKISELANNEVISLFVSAFIFLIVISYLIYKGIRHIMRPLSNLQRAVEQMSDGNYGTRVTVHSKDEIGRLSSTFNKMAESIQQEDEAQKTFLATVSHELRTPISYVKGYSEAMQKGIIPESQKEETIQLIVREANRMERLTNELLLLARMENEQAEITLYPIPLAETLREVQKILTHQAEKKTIALHLDADDALIIKADEVKLKQVFINIIENAINYSYEQSKVEITAFEDNGSAQITIKDYGIGIPQEDLSHVTERFYRVNKARSRADGGSGLGLSIVEQLLKQLQGKIEIESEVEKGTIVKITLPLMEE